VAFSVARQIIEMHGGRIWFGKSEAGEVECHVELPLVSGVEARATSAV
jgi:signal transduction histidine kinase